MNLGFVKIIIVKKTKNSNTKEWDKNQQTNYHHQKCHVIYYESTSTTYKNYIKTTPSIFAFL